MESSLPTITHREGVFAIPLTRPMVLGIVSRYPLPLNDSGQEISPEILELYGSGFKLIGRDLFGVSLTLNPAFYLNYAMTETNVADAVRKGVAEQEIRTWCSRTLPSVFGREEREVLFRGYVACLATG